MELGGVWFLSMLGGIVAAGGVGWGYFRWLSRPSRGSRGMLALLRTAAIGVVVVCLMEPTRVSTRTESVRSQVLFLLDRSQSMTLADATPDGKSRFEVARAALESLRERLADRFDLRFYAFDAALKPFRADEPLEPDGRATDLYGAVRGALEAARGMPVAGVFVLSDGVQNVGNLADIETDTVPLFTLGVGNPTAPKDLSVVAVNAEPVLFVGQKTTIQATLRAEGYPRRALTVTLAEEKTPLVRQTITLLPEETSRDVSLEWVPKKEGTFRYTVAVSPLLDEFTAENNARSFTVRVLPSRTRVLFVEGTPRHEFAFLKRTLERVPTFELTCVLLASPAVGSVAETIPSRTGVFPLERSLERWPPRGHLLPYDVVLMGDVALSQWTSAQREALREFVERRGGGVAWLAGEQWLARRNGAGSLEPLLPMTVPAEGARIQPGSFAPELTPEGRYHPITQLATSPEENDLLWRRMPLWSRLYGGLRPKPGTSVLVQSEGSAVVAFQRVGNGKSLLVATDALWGWAFASRLEGEDSYDRFWTQTVRWLATRSDAKQVNLRLGKSEYETGEVAEVNVRVYDAGFVPISDAAVRLLVTDPEGNRSELPATPLGDSPGGYRAFLRLASKGVYELQAEATSRGIRLGADTARLTAEAPRIEFERPARNDALLVGLAERSGGRFFPVQEAEKALPLLQERNQTRTLRVRHALWDHPFVLLTALLLLGVEWAWRKRAGLP